MSQSGPVPPASPQSLTELRSQIGQAFQQFSEQLLFTRQRVAATEARLELAEAGRKPRFPIEFRSQFGEDLWAWDVLGRATSGFFIEVGAFDGYHFSATYAFEAMGWNGLLIEPLPERYQACATRRPHSRVVHSALGGPAASGTITLTSVADQYGGMLSFTGGDTAHARQVAQSKHSTSSVSVPYTSMNALLSDHAGAIDLAVIDVEGNELDVLRGFDLERFRPRTLILEDNSMGRDPALGAYMEGRGYTFAGWLAVNRLYIRSDEARRLDVFRRF